MGRGGARKGAGRKKGATSPTMREHKRTLSEMAREHAPEALKTLLHIAKSGESESARVTAANAILDRGYGRPTQAHEHTGANGGPIPIVDLTNITDDQLTVLETVFGPLAGAGSDDEGDTSGEGSQGD